MMQGIAGAWVALAAVLTGATQLRPPGLPVGPGEVLLAGWILFVVFLLLRGTVTLGPIFRAILLYWLLAISLLGLGALMGSVIGFQDEKSAGHDSLAFLLAAVVSCLLGLQWENSGGEPFQLRLARQVFFLCAAATTALLVVGQFTQTLGPINLWYAGVRLRGWAENPNQLALFAVTMPFLGWYLRQQSRGHLRKTVYLATIAAAVAVGIATASDALRVAWIGALCAIGAVLWFRSIVRGRGRYLFVSYLLVPLAVIAFGAVVGEEIVLKIQDTFQTMYGELGQGQERIRLWADGIDTILRSPLVGIGPGRPGAGPLMGGEAHNSLIDWGMATGVLGILLHVGLLAWCALRALRAGSLPLFGIVLSLAGFCLLHYTLRQPIYWLMLMLVLTLSERRVAQPARGSAAVTQRWPTGHRVGLPHA